MHTILISDSQNPQQNQTKKLFLRFILSCSVLLYKLLYTFRKKRNKEKKPNPVITGRLKDVFETSTTYKRRLKNVFKMSCDHWEHNFKFFEKSIGSKRKLTTEKNTCTKRKSHYQLKALYENKHL